MKLVFKISNAAMEMVFNTLFNESDLFNSLEYVKKQNQLGFHVSLTVLDNSSGDYGNPSGYISDENDWLLREDVKLKDLVSFGWTTGGGSVLRVNTSTQMMEITGSRRSIRDRFQHLLCIGFDCEWRDWPRTSMGYVDYSKFDYTFKKGIELKQYITTEPNWLWFQNAHEAIRNITGRNVSELTHKTEAFLYASGLNSNQVKLVRMSAS